MSTAILKVSDDSFEADVLNADSPVLIEYWAEWCSPCRMMSPLLDQVSSEYAGKPTVAKLNIDDNPYMPQKYNVRGVPTLMLFNCGQVVATKIGAMAKSQLIAFVENNI